MSQVKRKAEEDIDQDRSEKKSVPSFKRPPFLQVAWDDGVGMGRMCIKYQYVKTSGCMEIPKDWVFASEIFLSLPEATSGIIVSKGVCGIIAQYSSSHEGHYQTVGIHSLYKRELRDSEDEEEEDDEEEEEDEPITDRHIQDNLAVCAVTGPFSPGYRYYVDLETLSRKVCKVEEYHDQYDDQYDDTRHCCPHVVYYHDFVVPWLSYL